MIKFIKHCFDYFKKDKPPKNIFYGFDLSTEYDYLGYSTIKYEFNNETQCLSNVHFFVSKKDLNIRKYHLEDNYFKNHTFIKDDVKLWQINEIDLYYPISDFPSNFLKKYMLKNYGYYWNCDENWWVSNDNSKYKQTQLNQQEKKITQENNVVNLFNKGNNDIL